MGKILGMEGVRSVRGIRDRNNRQRNDQCLNETCPKRNLAAKFNPLQFKVFPVIIISVQPRLLRKVSSAALLPRDHGKEHRNGKRLKEEGKRRGNRFKESALTFLKCFTLQPGDFSFAHARSFFFFFIFISRSHSHNVK